MYANTDGGRVTWTPRTERDPSKPWLPVATKFTRKSANRCHSPAVTFTLSEVNFNA